MINLDVHKYLATTQGEQKLPITLKLKAGALMAVFGASGVGKTSLLRILAGLASADSGTIFVQGNCWFDSEKGINWSAQKRKVGFVFQDYALFPNMTIWENLAFANNNAALIKELLAETALENLKDRKPHQLSGGQQQRVALARALVMQPSILLLDEPLSALDHAMRQNMQQLITNLHQKYKMTTIMVSHDIPEIINLADCMLLLEDGKSTQIDQPKAYFESKNSIQQLQLKATVLAIYENKIKIKIGKEISQMSLSPKLLADLKEGDEIAIDSLLLNPIIKKI